MGCLLVLLAVAGAWGALMAHPSPSELAAVVASPSEVVIPPTVVFSPAEWAEFRRRGGTEETAKLAVDGLSVQVSARTS